jgi:hypothetical protein
MRNGLLIVIGLGAVVTAAWAHHSIAATYDDKKPVTVTGIVTKYEWNNPHVYIYLDARESNGQYTRWSVEMDSTLDLRRNGWTRDSIKVGDSVTVEGILARDGSKVASAKSVTVAGKKMSAVVKDEAPRSASKAPTPRWPDGHPRLGTVPGEKGFWGDATPAGLFESTAGNIRMNREGLLTNIADAPKVAPFQPWAAALYEYRQRNLLKDDPMAFCLPPGGPRQFQDHYGIQIIEQPDRKRIFVISGGGNRNWRLIDMDGRPLAKIEDVTPTYYGYSVGHWDGDSLVVEAQAFTERFWFTNGGLPHTENLHLTERISRPDAGSLKYQVTVNDPGAYTRPWTGGWTLQWVPNVDLDEYFCDDNNKETEHLSGKHNSTTP